MNAHANVMVDVKFIGPGILGPIVQQGRTGATHSCICAIRLLLALVFSGSKVSIPRYTIPVNGVWMEDTCCFVCK